MFSYRAPWMNWVTPPQKLAVYKWCVEHVLGVWRVGSGRARDPTRLATQPRQQHTSYNIGHVIIILFL